MPESEALPAPEGHFYPWQLVGCRVLTEDGRDVGQVLRVESSPAQDLWAVGDGTHVLVEDGEGLVLAKVGGTERRSLTASCGPAFVTEVGWVLG